MDDSSLVLLGLICIGAVLLGPIGFFMTLGARARLKRVEAQLAALVAPTRPVEATQSAPLPSELDEAAATTPQQSGRVREAATVGPTTGPKLAEPAPAIAAPVMPDEASEPPSPEPASPAPEPRKIGIEERLGARWAVIVGGVALALGALLLVKYSIDQGFFGPSLRVAGGLLLGVALVAAGEVLRRTGPPEGASSSVPIPSVLTGAGTVAAFGSLYAAHALYGFIGPGAAFALMGAVGVATMFAAALHGPALAGLGLVGALGAPTLVSSTEPNPWPVVLFVAIVCAAAYGLARLRRWLWLAVAAALGAGLWQGLLLMGLHGANSIDFSLASLVHLIVETALVILVFAIQPHLAVPVEEQRTDRIASAAVLACAATASVVLAALSLDAGSGPAWIATAGLVAAMLALTGVRFPAAASASVGGGVVILAAVASWSASSGIALPYDFFEKLQEPESVRLSVSFGLSASLALGALCVWRLLDPAPMSWSKAAIYAGAGVLTPLAVVSLLYLRIADPRTSSAFAATAGAIAAAMAVGAAIFKPRRTREASPAIALGLGALAAGAIAALSLALVFELAEGTLTVALALAALGSALVDDRLEIPALRWCVVALALAIAGRFVYEPRIVGDALGTTILFNWLLFGYGAPALAFGLAARLMRRSREDAPVRVAQALAILCIALLLAFEIRHALNGGDPFAPTSGLIEQGVFALVGILFSLVLMELDVGRANPLYRYSSLGFGALTLIQSLGGLLFAQNPLLSGEPIEGGSVFNGLIVGYALPAVAAFILSWRARGRWPQWRCPAAMTVGMVLLFAWLNLELRRLFQGVPGIGESAPTSGGEYYAYSALWLTLGILLLAYGVIVGSKPARLASAAVVSLTVMKVFLLDLAGLEGVLRAFSFLGLGAALIGIGLVYQRLVFTKRPK